MNTQHTYSLLAAGVLACAVGGFSARTASAQGPLDAVTGDHHKLPVTAVGCLQRERDYRAEHSKHASRGGVGNEYVLVNSTVGVPSMPIAPAPEADVNNCSTQGNGQSIELTGRGERDLEQFVGRRVVISGDLKHARHDPEAVGTSGEFTPISKGKPLEGGGDLHLREVNVESFALAPIAAPVREEAALAPPEPAPARAQEPEPQAAPAPTPTPQAAPAPELPKTASPLPTVGLIGLLSLAGAFGLRLFARGQA